MHLFLASALPLISLWRTDQMFTCNCFLLVVLSTDSFGTHVRGKTGIITLSRVIKHAVTCAQPAQASLPTRFHLAYHAALGPFKRGLDVFQQKHKERWNLNSGCFHSLGDLVADLQLAAWLRRTGCVRQPTSFHPPPFSSPAAARVEFCQ